MTYLLAEQAAAAASTIDWTGITGFVIALGGIVAAILQFLGKKEAAAKAKEATAATAAVIQGVEVAVKQGDFTDLTKELKERTGLELTPEQLRLITSGTVKVVKGSIRATSQEHSVADYLAALVESKTTRIELTPEQREQLAKEADA